MPQAVASHSTPARATHRAPTARQRRKVLETALDRLLGVVEAVLADLDALDGDADLEPSLGAPIPYASVSQVHWAAGGDQDEREDVSEDEGGACEDEGGQDEREPENYYSCNWQDEGDQTRLRQLPTYSARPAPRLYQNVGAFMPVRAL